MTFIEGELPMADEGKRIRLKTLRRTDFVEVGKDRFDHHTSEFLNKVGRDNIISINPITYEHIDIATKQVVSDYGIIVIYVTDAEGAA